MVMIVLTPFRRTLLNWEKLFCWLLKIPLKWNSLHVVQKNLRITVEKIVLLLRTTLKLFKGLILLLIQLFLGLKAVNTSFYIPKLFRMYMPPRQKRATRVKSQISFQSKHLQISSLEVKSQYILLFKVL